MTPSMPPLNLNLTTASRSGDISAPNTVNFGGFGPGGGANGGIGGALGQYLPMAAAAAALFFILRR